jgi:HEAT repeat protein
VTQLDSLHDGDAVVGKLIACGPAAIEPLRQFLMRGRPSGTYQPRRWAVEALAALGAKEVLMDYLRSPKEIPDPVARFGEEAVESAAARELAAWKSEDVFDLLAELAQKRMLVGIVEALGEFGRLDSIPYFDRALEDDICRDAAEKAFRKIGQPAKIHLLESAVTPLRNRMEETPSSIRRRRSALRLLNEMELGNEDWKTIQTNLDDTDAEIVVLAAIIGTRAAGQDRAKMSRRLREVLSSAPWYLREEIESCLFGAASQPRR